MPLELVRGVYNNRQGLDSHAKLRHRIRGRPTVTAARLVFPRNVLGPDEVHVWHLYAEDAADPETLRPLEALLAPEEHARLRRYARLPDRRQSLLARVLARTVLSSYLDCCGGSLRFSTNAYGKPILLPGDAAAPFHFNLTHSHGAIACAVSTAHEVGIDVEDEGRRLQYLDLAERYFARPEAAYLRTLSEEQRPGAFFAIWTLKEAFVKSLGQGLTYPLDTFCFELAGDRLVGFRTLAPDVPRHWHFHQFRLAPRWRGAVAIPTAPGAAVRVCLRDWAATFLGRERSLPRDAEGLPAGG